MADHEKFALDTTRKTHRTSNHDCFFLRGLGTARTGFGCDLVIWHTDPATEKQINMITFLLDKINMRNSKHRKGLIAALGNNTFEVKDMNVGQANSVIWKLQHITAETFNTKIKESS